MISGTSLSDILSTLENYQKELPINLDETEIEHIFPQKQNPKEKEKYGNDLPYLRESLHRLGNLTLTTPKKNREMGNRNEEDKCEIDEEAIKKLWINEGRYGEFGRVHLEDRSAKLIAKALQIWRRENCKEDTNGEIFISESEEADWSSTTNTIPSSIYFTIYNEDDETNTKEFKITSWKSGLKKMEEEYRKISPQGVSDFMKNKPLSARETVKTMKQMLSSLKVFDEVKITYSKKIKKL